MSRLSGDPLEQPFSNSLRQSTIRLRFFLRIAAYLFPVVVVIIGRFDTISSLFCSAAAFLFCLFLPLLTTIAYGCLFHQEKKSSGRRVFLSQTLAFSLILFFLLPFHYSGTHILSLFVQTNCMPWHRAGVCFFWQFQTHSLAPLLVLEPLPGGSGTETLGIIYKRLGFC